jgi:hypothetical protein
MSRIVAVMLTLLGVVLTQVSQRMVDPLRVTSADDALQSMPSAEAMKVVSSGFHQPLADLLWMQMLFEFGVRTGRGDPQLANWLRNALHVVTELDPEWRTPYFYGGTMLRIEGDYDHSSQMFMAGAEQFPDDAWFPFSVGMNHFFTGDMTQASEWIRQASERPGAPGWYSEAAVAFRVQKESKETALRYLEEELASTTNPELKASLEARRDGVLHDLVAEQLAGVVVAFTQAQGRPPRDLDELVAKGWLNHVPLDPLGGEWAQDVDGQYLSSRKVDVLAEEDRMLSRKMLKSWAEVKVE